MEKLLIATVKIEVLSSSLKIGAMLIMNKGKGRIILGLLLTVLILIAYTYWDNNRIKIVEQEIGIDNISDDINGYRILQISDIHEKVFGENQENLIEKINSIEYDAIVFTGDMLINGDSKNYQPIYKLVEGIKNKDLALFVPGNSDPVSYVFDDKGKLRKHQFIEGLDMRGVKYLESIHTVVRGTSSIHFVDFELSVLDTQNGLLEGDAIAFIQHRNQLLKEMVKLDSAKPTDVVIALNHYPIIDARIDLLKINPNAVFRAYDLIIAGHYHGGQIRLPLIGALFVPEAYYERSGLFPPQDRVKGLWEYKQTKQYVSTGLGSSQTISFLKFRLFNTPEINLLTIKSNN